MSLAARIEHPDPITAIEDQLARSMHPVSPREEYVDRLHYRLTGSPKVIFEDPRAGWGLVFVFLGLFIGVLISYLMLLIFRRSR